MDFQNGTGRLGVGTCEHSKERSGFRKRVENLRLAEGISASQKGSVVD
jgi:hypothetical protein